MKRFYLLFFIILTVLTTTGCRVFDWFSKDSSSSSGSSSYTPPLIPETLEQEQPVVKARINELSQALIEKDVDKAISLCTRIDKYQTAFQNHKDKMPILGELLKTAKLTSVGPYNRNGCRIGAVAIDVASTSFTINVIKDNGKWYIQDF